MGFDQTWSDLRLLFILGCGFKSWVTFLLAYSHFVSFPALVLKWRSLCPHLGVFQASELGRTHIGGWRGGTLPGILLRRHILFIGVSTLGVGLGGTVSRLAGLWA